MSYESGRRSPAIASFVVEKEGNSYTSFYRKGDLHRSDSSLSALIRQVITDAAAGDSIYLHPNLSGGEAQADFDVSGTSGNPDTFCIAEITKDLNIFGSGTRLKLATGQNHTGLCGFVPNATGIRTHFWGITWMPQALSQTATYTPLVWPEKLSILTMRHCVGVETKYLTYGDSPSDNNAKRFVHFKDNIVDNTGTSNNGGFAGIGLHNQLHLCQVEGNTIRGGITGIFVDSAEDVLVGHNTLDGQYGQAIQVYDASNDSQVVGNNILGDPGSGNRRGVYIGAGGVNGATFRLRIAQNKIRGRQIAILIDADGGTDTLIEDNDFTGNATTITNNGTGTIIRRNRGYVTENTGSATVVNGTTSIVVNHGLATTPTRVLVTGTNDPTNAPGHVWITNKTSTQFTINVKSDPGASGAIFDWRAEV